MLLSSCDFSVKFVFKVDNANCGPSGVHDPQVRFKGVVRGGSIIQRIFKTLGLSFVSFE